MAIVRFVSGTGLGGAAIKWYTSSQWSHVEFWTPVGYLGSRINGGVQIRPYNYTGFDNQEFREYKLPTDAELALMNWADAQIGKGYDWLAIMALPLHRDWKSEENWFCSEYVAAAFEHAGYPIVAPDTQLSKVTPRDVSLCTSLKLIPPPQGVPVVSP